MKAEGEDEEDGMAEATRDGSAAGAASRPIEVAVLDDYQGVARELAAWDTLPAGSEVVVFREHLAEREELVQRLAPFEVIVAMRERTPFPRELLERLPALRLLVTTGRRNAAIDVVAAKERGVLVCGTDTLPYPTAELTIGLMIALARRIPEEDRALRALDMRVIAWSQNLTAERAAQASAEWVSRETLFRESDVLSIHLVLSERSRALVGEAELGMMKSSAFLINTSRGPIVDEAALIAALERKTIAGAGLDVFDCEPLPAGHPLLRLDNTVLTPHLGYVTRETYDIFYQQALEDIFGYLRGAPLRELSG
jgi:phosphoglycerate dehydrogenase-like enzyme